MDAITAALHLINQEDVLTRWFFALPPQIIAACEQAAANYGNDTGRAFAPFMGAVMALLYVTLVLGITLIVRRWGHKGSNICPHRKDKPDSAPF